MAKEKDDPPGCLHIWNVTTFRCQKCNLEASGEIRRGLIALGKKTPDGKDRKKANGG